MAQWWVHVTLEQSTGFRALDLALYILKVFVTGQDVFEFLNPPDIKRNNPFKEL